jgi:SAF domain-containing protein
VAQDDGTNGKMYVPRGRILALLLASLVAVVAWRLWRSSHSRPSGFAVARRALPAGTRIALADLTTASKATRPGDLISTEEAVDRITRREFRRGDALTDSALVPRYTPPDWVWLSIPLPPSQVFFPHERVYLLGIKDGEETGRFVSEEAIVVGAREGQVTVALPPNEAKEVIGYLQPKRRLLVLPHPHPGVTAKKPPP